MTRFCLSLPEWCRQQLRRIALRRSTRVLGVIALVLCYATYPSLTLSLFKGAQGIKEWIVSLTGNPQYEIIGRTVLHESSLVRMGFTLLSRVVVGAIIALGSRIMHGRDA